MFSACLRFLSLPILLFGTPAWAQPIGPDDLRPHIETLANERFQGRAPATEGERLTTDYIVSVLQQSGLQSGAAGGAWLQPVPLVERQTRSHRISWSRDGRPIEFGQGDIAVQGRDPMVRFTDMPVVFAGHGIRMLDRGIDQLAGAELRGALVLILFDAPQVPGLPSFAERVRAVTEAGAGAVIAITGADIQWSFVERNYRAPTTRLGDQVVAPVVGAMPLAAAQRLIAAGGGDLDRLLNAQPGSSFRSVTLPIRADLEVTTRIRPFTSHNVIGKLTGSGATGEGLVYLGHWDHFGICRPEGAADRICNGAVDNASGIAAMLEIAERLAAGPKPVRDIYFLATTAEETGLLGADFFARNPPIPTERIVAAINLDTVAIHPAGEPVAVIGRGHAELDAVIDSTVEAMGRRLDADDEASAFVQRQDGWALARAGIPAVMVGGSFSNMDLLNAFLSGRYHGPEDEPDSSLVLDGAAEDANLLVELGRRLADPARYRRGDAAQ